MQLELVCLRKTAHRLLENEKTGIQHSDAKLSQGLTVKNIPHQKLFILQILKTPERSKSLR